MLLACSATAQPVADLRVGDTYALERSYSTAYRTNDDGEGTSGGHTALIERVVAIRGDGVELEYDLAASVTPEQRGPVWQLPTRVLRSATGEMRLLNVAELEARRDAWLERAQLPRSACGRWYFTWNAFQVECDVQGALTTVESYRLDRGEVRVGAMHREEGMLEPVPIRMVSSGPEGAVFTVDLVIDPDWMRRQEAETLRVLAEISNPEQRRLMETRSAIETVSGTMLIRFETDAAGRVLRRVKTTRVEVRRVGGRIETREGTETLERRRMSAAPQA